MQDFRGLHVWEKAHSLVLGVYEATGRFPKEEVYALTSQVRRAAVSVPSNIAEGCGRGTDAEFARFLQIAMGSACELEYQLFLAYELGYLPPDVHNPLDSRVGEVKRMLAAFLRKVRP